MTYTFLNLAFLALPILLAAAWIRGRWWLVALKSLLALFATTAVFDNVIIGLGIVAYHRESILGIYLGLAPVEDFAYSLAAVLLITAFWSRHETRNK